MEDDEPENRRRRSPPPMSKTPSWVMLGFLLGAAFVWAFQRGREKPAAAAPGLLTSWSKAVSVGPSPLTTIEAVFAEWGGRAVWDNDLTEVALWRTETAAFSEFYEVKRVGEALYFRSIPKLTRPIIRHGPPLPRESPLQFTETEAQYREWFEHGRFERAAEATVQPSLFGPALIPAGEGMPRVQAPKPTPTPVPVPVASEIEKTKIDLPPKR